MRSESFRIKALVRHIDEAAIRLCTAASRRPFSIQAATRDNDLTEQPFTLGIEKECLLVDLETGALTYASDDLPEACAAELEGQVSPEFLQCHIEIGTQRR